jgi:hypothetical protein
MSDGTSEGYVGNGKVNTDRMTIKSVSSSLDMYKEDFKRIGNGQAYSYILVLLERAAELEKQLEEKSEDIYKTNTFTGVDPNDMPGMGVSGIGCVCDKPTSVLDPYISELAQVAIYMTKEDIPHFSGSSGRTALEAVIAMAEAFCKEKLNG